MGFGFVADIFLFYLFQTMARWLKHVRSKSRAWPKVEADITASHYDCPGFGCPSIEIAYVYNVDGHIYSGLYEKPFILGSSAKYYSRHFAPGVKLVARINAGDPATSLVRDGDQPFWGPPLDPPKQTTVEFLC